jgi:hypothetical protein
VREAIERARPYGDGNTNLYRLHRLDIADKHRLLVTVGAANRSVGFKLPPLPLLPGQTDPIESPTIFLRPADRLLPIKDGDVVAGVSAQVRQEGGIDPPVIVFELAFGDEESVRGEPVAEPLLRFWRKSDSLSRQCQRLAHEWPALRGVPGLGRKWEARPGTFGSFSWIFAVVEPRRLHLWLLSTPAISVRCAAAGDRRKDGSR